MPLDRADLKLLWDMLEAAERARSHIFGMTMEGYLADAKTRDAVERTIEIVGEAARGVSAAGRRQVAGVEWTKIVATRHIIAHDYGDIEHDQIWRIVTVHIPELISRLRPVLDANPPSATSQLDPSEPR